MGKATCWFCEEEFYEAAAFRPVVVTLTKASIFDAIFWTRVRGGRSWEKREVKVPRCPSCYEAHLTSRKVALWGGVAIGLISALLITAVFGGGPAGFLWVAFVCGFITRQILRRFRGGSRSVLKYHPDVLSLLEQGFHTHNPSGPTIVDY